MWYRLINISCILIICSTAFAQNDSLYTLYEEKIDRLAATELVQSMSQRSLLTPGYFPELKALIARQAYEFWKENSNEKYVSHLNVYSALYYANKYLGYDSITHQAFNQVLGHSESVVSLKFGNNQSKFYSAGSDGRVLLWDMEKIKAPPVLLYKGDHLIRSIDISPDGQWIMVVSKDQGIFFIPGRKLEEASEYYSHFPEKVMAAAFLPGSDQFLMVDRTGNIRIRGYNGDESIDRTMEKILSLEVNDDSGEIYLGTLSGKLQKIDRPGEIRNVAFSESFAINDIAISHNQKLLALGREKGDAILWDLEKDTIVRVISGHQSAITDLDFSPDDSLLLTASRDRTVRLWDVHDTRKLPLMLDDHDDWVLAASFVPDGKKIITGSKDNYIRLWPVEHKPLADRICRFISRNLTPAEWDEYVGGQFPYRKTCPLKR